MLHGSPWLYMYTHCHQMVTQQWRKGPWGLLQVIPKLRVFRQHKAGLKMAKSSLVGPHRGGLILENWRPAIA